MAEWTFAWRVTLTYRSARESPDGYARDWDAVVYSVADLRRLVVDRYRDPAVTARRWYRYPAMVGEHPTTCPARHPLEQHGGRGKPHEWHQCDCGGHIVLRCACVGSVTLDPPLHPRCCRPWPGPESVRDPADSTGRTDTSGSTESSGRHTGRGPTRPAVGWQAGARFDDV